MIKFDTFDKINKKQFKLKNMKRRKQKLIERDEYPFCQPMGTELPKRKLTKTFETYRSQYRQYESLRKAKVCQLITQLSNNQKLRDFNEESRIKKIGNIFSTIKCVECSKDTISNLATLLKLSIY